MTNYTFFSNNAQNSAMKHWFHFVSNCGKVFSKINSVMIASWKSMTSKRLKNLCLLSFDRDITARLEKNIALVISEYYK